MTQKAFNTRFAPSPTGNLHLGHGYSALFAARKAQETDGKFILRIENIDDGRCSTEAEKGIYDDLSWLGLNWDKPVMRQSERMDAYKAALVTLLEKGVLYPCFCSRKDIQNAIDDDLNAPHSFEGPIYPKTCLHLSQGEIDVKMATGVPYALRLNSEKAEALIGRDLTWFDREKGEQTVDLSVMGDFVVARKDIATSYHLAVVVDDAAQGINLVTRGVDLFPATHAQVVLQALLGYPTPEYWHHKLITDDNGTRIAKRDNPLTLKQMRQSGMSAQDVLLWLEKEF